MSSVQDVQTALTTPSTGTKKSRTTCRPSIFETAPMPPRMSPPVAMASTNVASSERPRRRSSHNVNYNEDEDEDEVEDAGHMDASPEDPQPPQTETQPQKRQRRTRWSEEERDKFLWGIHEFNPTVKKNEAWEQIARLFEGRQPRAVYDQLYSFFKVNQPIYRKLRAKYEEQYGECVGLAASTKSSKATIGHKENSTTREIDTRKETRSRRRESKRPIRYQNIQGTSESANPAICSQSQTKRAKKLERASPVEQDEESPNLAESAKTKRANQRKGDVPMEQDKESPKLAEATRNYTVNGEDTRQDMSDQNPPRNAIIESTQSPVSAARPPELSSNALTREELDESSDSEQMSIDKKPSQNVAPLAAPPPYETMPDPNSLYIEEEAFRYHNPPLPSAITAGVLPANLCPIPPPDKMPKPPTDTKCKWSVDEANRVYIADFRDYQWPMDPQDEKFMLDIMERDDLTLVSDGLLNVQGINPDLWSIENVASTFLDEFYHKFRRFDRVLTSEHPIIREVDGLYSMRMTDYQDFLVKRQHCLEFDGPPEFNFQDHVGAQHSVDVRESSFYCIDVDMKKLLKEMYDDFMKNFRLPSMLPGGEYCLMHYVTEEARPFMGPNLYITPADTFTHFHQDGHGTVDSGHLAVSGYNEIVILRRLTERHKRHALWLLTGNQNHGMKSTQYYFDGLYSEPHGDGLGEKPAWPTADRIEKCRNMGYCPSVLILREGQHVHINKGRLHAFRKLSTNELPVNDCHYLMRKKLIDELGMSREPLCVSIAWDWSFLGVTRRGIYRETTTTLEATTLNRRRGVRSLAIPEFSLLEAARQLGKSNIKSQLPGLLGSLGGASFRAKEDAMQDRRIDICRGILPSLKYIVNEHLQALQKVESSGTKRSWQRCERVTLARRPDTHEDPTKTSIDPRGNEGFVCKTCSKELSNIYFHCDGCEKLLAKDFNICTACHAAGKFQCMFIMHPQKTKRHATINHVGDMRFDRSARCPCKNGPACSDCNYCLGCSCRCHTWFTLHSRVHSKNAELELLRRIEDIAKNGQHQNPDGYLDEQQLTNERLDLAKKGWGHFDDFNV